MKIIITASTTLDALRLRDQVLNTIKGLDINHTIDTWEYVKSGDNYDIIFHNPKQYTDEDKSKNVLFRVSVDGVNLVFTTAWWSVNPEPSREMLCLHTGRLTEMLLAHFGKNIIKYSISDF